MQANARLFCQKCQQFTAHVTQAKYDWSGALSKTVERCTHCLTETAPGNGHEIPADAPDLDPYPLTALEVSRTLFIRHLVKRGVFTDETETPGVWA